jgi:TusE/DsrC/DsvC family sulfur relay protein
MTCRQHLIRSKRPWLLWHDKRMDEQFRKLKTGDSRQIRTIADRKIIFDREGFLFDFEDWSEDLFGVLAKEAGLLEIHDRQWLVIRFLREFYALNGRSPSHRQLREGTGMSLLELEKLFPGGIRHGARRMAGLPNPKDCT